jgi:hypothetical protein
LCYTCTGRRKRKETETEVKKALMTASETETDSVLDSLQRRQEKQETESVTFTVVAGEVRQQNGSGTVWRALETMGLKKALKKISHENSPNRPPFI